MDETSGLLWIHISHVRRLALSRPSLLIAFFHSKTQHSEWSPRPPLAARCNCTADGPVDVQTGMCTAIASGLVKGLRCQIAAPWDHSERYPVCTILDGGMGNPGSPEIKTHGPHRRAPKMLAPLVSGWRRQQGSPASGTGNAPSECGRGGHRQVVASSHSTAPGDGGTAGRGRSRWRHGNHDLIVASGHPLGYLRTPSGALAGQRELLSTVAQTGTLHRSDPVQRQRDSNH